MRSLSQINLVSVVIPIYNEAGSIETTVKSLVSAIGKDSIEKSNLSYEIILVNDGSKDNTDSVCAKIIKKQANDRIKIRYLKLTRNFGKEAALYAGYSFAKGDAAGSLDADGQHPPEDLIAMVNILATSDKEAVIGVRKDQTHKKIGFMSTFFYWLSKKSGNQSTLANGTDFRVMRRDVLDDFLRMQEHGRVNRDIMDWLGYDYSVYEFEVKSRTAGKATYSLKKLFILALDSLVASGSKPLLYMFPVGFTIFLFSSGGLIVSAVDEFVFSDALGLNITNQGYALLLIVSLFGVVLSLLGVLALYVGRISTEVQNRPQYVVDKRKCINL